jgi:hypothetical protein
MATFLLAAVLGFLCITHPGRKPTFTGSIEVRKSRSVVRNAESSS